MSEPYPNIHRLSSLDTSLLSRPTQELNKIPVAKKNILSDARRWMRGKSIPGVRGEGRGGGGGVRDDGWGVRGLRQKVNETKLDE